MYKVSQNLKPISIDLGLFIVRIAGSGILLIYGSSKLMNFSARWHKFSDPLGIGHEASFILCVFAEFFCSVFLLAGAFTRVALIPLLINMTVIVFLVHRGDPIKEKTLAILLLTVFTGLFFTGPGKFSVDGLRK